MTIKKYLVLLIILCIKIELISQNTTQLLIPFEINIDPMEKLLLVNIENDPDSLYIGFEPQQFNDSINGKGHIVIAWRFDDKVDVYHEPGITVCPSKYDITGKGLANMLERQFSKPYFEISETGVKAYYQFYDLHDREIIISISENNTKKRKPFGLLAPMGVAVERPTSLPLIMLLDFYFVRQKNSEISITINGNQHQTDNLPLPIDRSKMTFIRYSPNPIIATINPAFSGIISSYEIEEEQESLYFNNYEINLQWTDGQSFIKSITKHNDVYPVKLVFKKPFPNLAAYDGHSAYQGRFTIQSHPSIGTVKGTYNVEIINNEMIVRFVPSKGWAPKKTKLSLRFLYRVSKVFRNWPTTYEWTAKISKAENDFYMDSKWSRE